MSPARLALLLAAAVLLNGCGIFRAKSRVAIPPLLGPLVEADSAMMFAEVNRLASVRAINGRIDFQFLDTSFAECGLADLYRTAEGRVVVQRPGQVYVLVEFYGVKLAEMSSNGQRFWAALYKGDDKFRRFVTGTNSAVYEKLGPNGNSASPNCGGSGKKREEAMQRATVSALSSLRPQHFTDALLVPTLSPDDPSRIYSVAETFEEEADTRTGAKKGARVVRGYYVLAEMETQQGSNRARVLRRFWFDRVGTLRLARVQTYGEAGRLLTDVVYGNPQPFGEEGGPRLPAQVELTRPQDHYSLRVIFQDPVAVKIDQPLPDESFVLKNSNNLPETDLDAGKK
ncbi:MAG TPA: hypothetical protein VGX48_09200 [Pyrinomonadaceae bacterium]|nr:hypothetical protein [Pyrinomonadaceae bacterium]